MPIKYSMRKRRNPPGLMDLTGMVAMRVRLLGGTEGSSPLLLSRNKLERSSQKLEEDDCKADVVVEIR